MWLLGVYYLFIYIYPVSKKNPKSWTVYIQVAIYKADQIVIEEVIEQA